MTSLFWATDAAFSQNTPETLQPTYLPKFEGSDNVVSAVFAPDKPVLYVHSHVLTANLWPNLVALWPEALSVVTTILTLVFIVILVRIRRRRRVAGVPYCCRCNYDLTPQVRAADGGQFAWPAGTLCPECGTSLDRKPPIRGRRYLRRAAPVLTASLLLLAAYFGMTLAGFSRHGSAGGWIDLSSSWVARHADHWAIRWLRPALAESDQVVAIDLTTGEMSRVITTRSSISYFRMAASPDGSALFLCRRWSAGMAGGVDAVSTASGRTVGEAALPGDGHLDVGGDSVLGFSPDGSTAYVQWWNREGGKAGISSWRWRDGARTVTLTEASGVGDWPGFYLFRDHNGADGSPRFISLPNFMEVFPNKEKYGIGLIEAGAETRQRAVNPSPDPKQNPVVSADGTELFLAADYGETLLRLSLDSTREAEPVPVPGRGLGDKPARSAGGRFLVVAGGTGLLVYDLVDRAWGEWLALPRQLYGQDPIVSPDGRFIAAVCQGDGIGPGKYIKNVVIWKLGSQRLNESPHRDQR